MAAALTMTSVVPCVFLLWMFYYPNSMGTILSFTEISAIDGVFITVGTRSKNAILVNINDKHVLKFLQCYDGRYYYDTANPVAHMDNDTNAAVTPYLFLQTTEENKSYFTKRKIL